MKTLGCTYDEKQVGMFLWGKIPASCKDVEELTEKVLHEARAVSYTHLALRYIIEGFQP